MQRPGKDVKRRRVMNNGKMRDVELRERSSRSLLANVLDMDDNYRVGGNGNGIDRRVGGGGGGSHNDMRHHNHHAAHSDMSNANYYTTGGQHVGGGKEGGGGGGGTHKIHRNSSVNSQTVFSGGGMGNHVNSTASMGQTQQQYCDQMGGYQQQNTTVFKDILNEIRFLTDKRRKEDDFEEQCNDWKFAALVIDRLCLWVFTAFTIVSTCGILFSAPHIFE